MQWWFATERKKTVSRKENDLASVMDPCWIASGVAVRIPHTMKIRDATC